MITRPERKIFPKIVFALALVAVLVFLNHRGYLDPVKNFITRSAIFGSKSALNATSGSRTALFSLSSLKQLQSQNQKIQELELNMKTLSLEKQELENENNQLRNQLKLLPKEKFSLTGADIIAFDPLSLEEFAIINKGKNHGLKQGMPVIIYDRVLIGSIYEVEKSYSKVLLSVSPLSTFNAALAKDQVIGVARGKYNLEITLDLIPNQTQIDQGDLVVTSGRHHQYPQGLLAGEVISSSLSPDGLFKQVVVKPFYSMNDLRQVFVITNSQ
ncbi:MAG: rod shape-determining protein MreC [Patescibacteria group bacterium]|nr:rod shape-determining protein MreC [Patescibacteria group bacterium]